MEGAARQLAALLGCSRRRGSQASMQGYKLFMSAGIAGTRA